MHEKCTDEIKLRVSPSLLLSLSRLAHAEDRSLSEYVRTVVSIHCVGHAHRLDKAAGKMEGNNVPCEGQR